jgi:hypothetical protein
LVLGRTDADLNARLDAWTKAYGLAVNAAFDLGRAYRSGNNVQPLVDGESCIGYLCTELNALQTDNVLLITGWEFSKQRFLKRSDQANTILHRLLCNLIQNQVSVAVIVFTNCIPTLGPGGVAGSSAGLLIRQL